MNRTPCRYPSGPLLRIPAELDLHELASEEVRHLSRARVVIAEYDVLQHDFPELNRDHLIFINPDLRLLSPSEQASAIRLIIDEWLIMNGAYISSTQASQSVVNTPICTDTHSTVAYRPPRYGRAVVVPTQRVETGTGEGRWRLPACSGMLDLKGAGVSPFKTPAKGVQSNGLEYLDVAVSDFLIKKAIDLILARALPTVWTVPVYAVLDLGFDIVEGYHGAGPAGMHVRRAHRRRVAPDMSSVEDVVTFEIESVLRRYGLTAATRGLQLHCSNSNGYVTWQTGDKPRVCIRDPTRIAVSLALLRDTDTLTLDRRDVQLARDVSWPPAQAQIVDFGAIRVESRFDCPMLRYSDAPTLREVIWPNDAHFIQPRADLQLPVATWNRYHLKTLCADLIDAFRHNLILSHDLRRTIDDCLLALVAKWDNTQIAGKHE